MAFLTVVAVPLLRGDLVVAAQTAAREAIPEFSLKTTAGGTFSLRREDGQIRIAHDEVDAKPRVLIVHFLQPDCLQCQSEVKTLEATHRKYAGKGASVIGIAHREDAEAARSLTHRLQVSYPILLGTGSDVARQLAGGDALYIADEHGSVRFSQAGYGTGDEALWHENVDLLLAGKPVVKTTSERENLDVGDRLPTVKLDSLMTGEEISLTGKDGQLTFTDARGHSSRPKAAIGLFARYCAFTREEMAHLQRLHDEYAKDGLLVFAIALHPRPATAKALTRELGVTYPVFEGHGSELGKRYGFG
jgi:peroxiredoxin